MLSSRSFIILGLTFRALIHFELMLVQWKVRVQFLPFAHGDTVFPPPFVEEISNRKFVWPSLFYIPLFVLFYLKLILSLLLSLEKHLSIYLFYFFCHLLFDVTLTNNMYFIFKHCICLLIKKLQSMYVYLIGVLAFII